MKRNGRMTRKITYSALFLAVAILLPFLTGQIPTVGRFLSPMHIPAFLCGFVCGPWWGAAVGAASPLLRSLMLGMPPMPTAAFMAIELAVYGAASGLFRRIFPKRICSYIRHFCFR